MNVISTDMDITSEMKRDAETKAKEFLGHTEINEAEVSKQMKNYFDNKYQPNWQKIFFLLFLMKKILLFSSLLVKFQSYFIN